MARHEMGNERDWRKSSSHVADVDSADGAYIYAARNHHSRAAALGARRWHALRPSMDGVQRRVAVLGSGKTVNRYAEHLGEAGADARAVEVLRFCVNHDAVARAAKLILDAQRVAARGPSCENDGDDAAGPRLQLILTSSVAVGALHAALDEAMALARATEPGTTFDPLRTAVLTLKGCGTASACAACGAFSNVSFSGKRLRDIYAHLETQPPPVGSGGRVRTVVLGVASGGDRSYRSSPILGNWIEELPVYDSTEGADAPALVRSTLSWLGPAGGDLIVTSSKSAAILARVLAEQFPADDTDRAASSPRPRFQLVAQGPSTAATLHTALAAWVRLEAAEEEPKAGDGAPSIEVVTPAAPNIEAITELLNLAGGHTKHTQAKLADPTLLLPTPLAVV
jgi:hypothetical protein